MSSKANTPDGQAKEISDVMDYRYVLDSEVAEIALNLSGRTRVCRMRSFRGIRPCETELLAIVAT